MTDDDIFNLFKPGKECSRDSICDALDVYDDEGRVFVSRALGRLKRWGKVSKTETGNWVLASAEQQAMKKLNSAKPKLTASKQKTKNLQNSPATKDTTKTEPLKADKPNVKDPEGLTLNEALLRVENRLNKPGVTQLDEKIYTLEFLGKLLDPTINALFESIITDLRGMNS